MTTALIVCYAIASLHLAIATLTGAARVTLAHAAAAIGLALAWPVVAVWSTGATLAFDLLRHRDGLSRSAVAVRVAVATVLWPLVVVAGFAARGRR